MSEKLKEELAEVIRYYNTLGWSPATSTNYSFKDANDIIHVSRSGVDKANFRTEDFITVDSVGKPLENYPNKKPSAETLIHCIIYQLFPSAKVILHSHGPYPVCLSKVLSHKVEFEGYEVQKGFEGQQSHLTKVSIPIVENSQDMDFFDTELRNRKSELNNYSFIIKGHGTYAWGENLAQAKRHLETLDYLCKCEWMLYQKE